LPWKKSVLTSITVRWNRYWQNCMEV